MLMLRFCACIPVTDIARWFDQDGETVQRRLHRAKQKLEQSGARFEMPPSDQWRERLPPVLSAIEILYDQSYSNVAGGVEQDGFAREGEQLALQLCAHLNDPEALGLAALIVFAESRRAARLDAQHVMVPLSHQDCARWDGVRIATAAKLLKRAASMNQPGPYQLRALISAQHARRAQLGHTPWHEICELYEHLVALPDVADLSVWLNQALAIGERDGAAAGLQRLQSIDATWSVESLPTRLKLARLLALAHLLELAQNKEEARKQREAALALDRAHSLLGAAERAWIERQIACPGVGGRPAGSSTAVN
jgi:RNA polymerase sigma-70 factor (ECF subfamily)